jgi:DNA-binding response OmpR family regulator
MKRILIIDDDPDFVEATRLVLVREGYDVISAGSGGDGLRRIREDAPDLIILDIIMDTVLEGLYVSRELAEDPDRRDVPILMVTSIANSDYAALFPTDEYIHISDFVSKPITPEQLLARVAALLARAAPSAGQSG